MIVTLSHILKKNIIFSFAQIVWKEELKKNIK